MTTTSMREEIKVGELAIRFVIEGEDSGGSVAAFEFDVPTGARVAAAHSHDGFEETIYGAYVRPVAQSPTCSPVRPWAGTTTTSSSS